MGNAPFLGLVKGKVLEPFLEEGIGSHIIACCAAENLGITCPSKTFITLRTVGGDIDEITLQSPQDIMLQLVEIRVGTRKATRLWHVGVNNIGLEIIKIRASWERFNMDEPKPKKGEMGTIYKWFVILDGVGYSLFSPAEVVGVDIAVLIQYFETTQDYGLSCLSFTPDLR
jgi:hypothetical protein